MEDSDALSEDSFEKVGGISSRSSSISENGPTVEELQERLTFLESSLAGKEQQWREALEIKDDEIRELKKAMEAAEREKIEALDELALAQIGLGDREDIILEKIQKIYELEDELDRMGSSSSTTVRRRRLTSAERRRRRERHFDNWVQRAPSPPPKAPSPELLSSRILSIFSEENIGFYSIPADVLGTLLVLSFTDVVGEPSLEKIAMFFMYIVTCAGCITAQRRKTRITAQGVYFVLMVARLLLAVLSLSLIQFTPLLSFLVHLMTMQTYLAYKYAKHLDRCLHGNSNDYEGV